MHGTVDIITVEMVREQIKKIFLSLEGCDKKKLEKYLCIAMVAFVVIIAIILVNILKKNETERQNNTYVESRIETMEVTLSDDQEIYGFINDYFQARTNLNYPKIFSFFGRDYYREEREDKNGSFKKTIDNIRYEKIFVKSYDNIKVYTCRGYNDNEKVCVVTYDLALGFTDDVAPMIIIFYIVEKDGKYIIKDNLDVGESKYIIDVSKSQSVKSIYNDVYTRLNRVLISNESLRLSYNSLRQYEMNMSSNMDPINKTEIIDSIGIKGIDPIEDADKIYNNIASAKESESVQKKLDEYLERVIASLSDVQRAH